MRGERGSSLAERGGPLQTADRRVRGEDTTRAPLYMPCPSQPEDNLFLRLQAAPAGRGQRSERSERSASSSLLPNAARRLAIGLAAKQFFARSAKNSYNALSTSLVELEFPKRFSNSPRDVKHTPGSANLGQGALHFTSGVNPPYHHPK